ncbi:hypothetical protein AHAS_Ahas03G0115500 [Arachis hypogaea]
MSHWVPGIRSLKDLALINLEENNKDNDTLEDYATIEGNWKWETICQLLPEEVSDTIRTLKAPHHSLGSDRVCWFPDSQGTFTIKSAYHTYCVEEEDPDNIYKNYWKIRVP